MSYSDKQVLDLINFLEWLDVAPDFPDEMTHEDIAKQYLEERFNGRFQDPATLVAGRRVDG